MDKELKKGGDKLDKSNLESLTHRMGGEKGTVGEDNRFHPKKSCPNTERRKKIQKKGQHTMGSLGNRTKQKEDRGGGGRFLHFQNCSGKALIVETFHQCEKSQLSGDGLKKQTCGDIIKTYSILSREGIGG